MRKENRNVMLENVEKVAIPFGYSAYTWTEPFHTYNINSMPARDLNTALYSVAQRSVDAADVEYNIGQHLINNNPLLKDLVVNLNLPSANVDYHLSSIKHIIILEKLTSFVQQEKELMGQLRQQYGVKNYDEVYTIE